MKNHTKVYFKALGLSKTDWVECETCGKTAVDIHHIYGRGMGGSKEKDYIENLMAVCRACHLDAEASKLSKDYLKSIHKQFLGVR